MLNESVIKVLKNGMWDLATCADGEPNVVPVAFKDVTEDGKLVVGDVFLETTLNNIKANGGKIAISAYDVHSNMDLRYLAENGNHASYVCCLPVRNCVTVKSVRQCITSRMRCLRRR